MVEAEVLDLVVHALVVQEEVVELLVSNLQVVLAEGEEVVPLKGVEEVVEELGAVAEEPPWMVMRVFRPTVTRKDSSWKLFSVGLSPPPAL